MRDDSSCLKLLVFLFSIFFMCGPAVAQTPVAFFYDKHVPVPEICLYDKAVVDPNSDFNPKESCHSINQAFAYVSVGEVPKNASYIKSIKPTWVIGKNEAWNNNLIIDQTNTEWQKFFIDQIITPLWEKGYQGFFFDTLDSYFLSAHTTALQQKQIDSIVSLIQQVKLKYPQAKIILNRGFQLLPPLHADIDAVVIESLYHAWNEKKQQYEDTPLAEQKNLLTEINNIKQMHLPIIIIDYLPPAQQKQAADLSQKITQQGLVPWITNNELNQIYIKKIQNVGREILILFNNDDQSPTRFAPSFMLLGTLIEYLGYVPKYIDLNVTKQLPTNDLNNKYSGIILWLDAISSKNVLLLNWVKKQITSHVPVVFINSFGVPIETAELKDLGLITSSVKISDKSLQISKIDRRYVGLEVSPSISPYDFFPLHANSSQVLLQMKNEYQQIEDVVAITPWGGYAVTPDVVFYMPNYNSLWGIDPINFLQSALRLQDFPVPVATTENGRRLMTVHIDGDGFSYPSNWIGGTFAGNELLKNILNQYHVPTSVSVITGEIAPNGIHPKQSKELMQAARNLFALPWVESASHSFSHPFYWQEATHKHFESLFGGEPFYIKLPNYTFNLETEIKGSVDFINKNLVPSNKKCQLFFWSGMAEPSVEALKIASDNHLLNINGESETHIDDQYPSLTGIRPMGLEIGGYYQVFAPIDMDYYYMHGFAGPLYGYEHVTQTFQLTDKPRRFKPIDLYYHFYSASSLASLQALHTVYRWALAQPVMNIYTSDYIKKVVDYYQMTISKNGPSWWFHSGSELRELRSAKNFGYPNLIASKNVIGFNENKDTLYIHLGPSPLTVLNYQKEKPIQPYLVEANARVTSYVRNDKQLVIKFQGYMPLQFTLANVSACQVSTQNPFKITKNQNNTIGYHSDKENDEIHINC